MISNFLVRHERRLHWLAPSAIFTLLSVLMTWPLALHLRTATIGVPNGDNYYFTWLIGRFQQLLAEQHLSFHVPFLNYPHGWNLTDNEITPAMVLLALPFSFVGGPTLGYNMAVVLSFVLSGLGAYLWTVRLTNNRAAAVLAGTIFAFAPYRMFHAYGHLNLLGTQWLPWYFWSLDTLLHQRWQWRPALVGASMLGLIALTSQYYLYMAVIVSAAYVLGYVLLVNRRALRQRSFWQPLIGLGLLAALPVILAVAPYLLHLRTQGYSVQRPFEEARRWSASVPDFFRPSPEHPVWGSTIQQWLQRPVAWETTIYIGAAAGVLAVIALLARRRGGSDPALSNTTKLLGWTSVCTAVLALGVDWQWLGEPVIVDVPQWLQRWHPYERTFIPLPGYFLFKYLPFYDGMRVWARYGVFVNLFVAVLAGIGAAYVVQRVSRRWATPVAGVLCLLVLGDFAVGPRPLVDMRARPVDAWLAQQPNGAIAQLPWTEMGPDDVYYTRFHGKPYIGAFWAIWPPEFERTMLILNTFPDQPSVDLLRELDVRYVLLDRTQYSNIDQIDQQVQALGLRLLTVQDDQHVYALND